MQEPVQGREQRFPSDVAVRLFLDKEQYRAYSLNVSANGACLSGMGRLLEGTQVTIRYRHLCIKGRIAWSTHLATGVQFIEPLARADLQKLRGTEIEAADERSNVEMGAGRE